MQQLCTVGKFLDQNNVFSERNEKFLVPCSPQCHHKMSLSWFVLSPVCRWDGVNEVAICSMQLTRSWYQRSHLIALLHNIMQLALL